MIANPLGTFSCIVCHKCHSECGAADFEAQNKPNHDFGGKIKPENWRVCRPPAKMGVPHLSKITPRSIHSFYTSSPEVSRFVWFHEMTGQSIPTSRLGNCLTDRQRANHIAETTYSFTAHWCTLLQLKQLLKIYADRVDAVAKEIAAMQLLCMEYVD